jgi:branched-chain amino acid aminotransferase
MVSTLDFSVQTIAHSRLSDTDFQNLGFGKVFSDHMFVANYKQGEWQEMTIMPYGNLSFSPALMTLHYGQSIFEGMKAHRNKDGEIVIFRPDENHKRMVKSAERMCMAHVPEELFMESLQKLIQLDHKWVPNVEGSSLYIRPYMFGSDEFIGMHPSDNYAFIIFTCPVGAYYAKPVRVKIETKFVRAIEGGVGGAKTSGNYAASMYATKLASEEGYDQIIWTDGKEHKYIEEAGTMNLIFKINGKIITAPAGDTILAGITRKSILHLAKHWGYEVEERKFAVSELIESLENGTFEEAFGAGTAAVIAPISSIGYNGKDYVLAPLKEDGFALQARKYLNDLVKGHIEDEFNWLYYPLRG